MSDKSDKNVVYVKEKRRWNIGGFIMLILSIIAFFFILDLFNGTIGLINGF